MTTLIKMVIAVPTDDSPRLSAKVVLVAITAIVNFSFAFLIKLFILKSLAFYHHFFDTV